MRKIIEIFIITLFIGTAISSVGMNNKSINEETKSNMYQIDQNQYSNFNYIYINRDGIFNPPVMTIEYEQFVDDSISSEKIFVDLPEYFSWKDHEGQDWTTPAKSQGNCGSCWDFAALGALESVINIREGIVDLDPDLSEQYVLSCLPFSGSCNGGGPSATYLFIFKNTSGGNYCNGIIPEACFPYQADDTIPCDAKWDNWMDFLTPISDYGSFYPSIDAIKTKIMENGPLTCNMFVNDNFTVWGYTNHNPDDYFHFEAELDINHCIVVFGWKDDSSIGKGGYWICKNSWGPTFGYDGFFNLEYDSLGFNRTSASWVNYNPDDYDWHPVPKVNGPYYGLVEEPVVFQGEAAGEHTPFTYYWDFGDDSTSTEQNPSHTYSVQGEYTVQLTVTDDNGKSMAEETFAWIQETNQPPSTPTIEGSSEAIKGEYCWYNITFSDPDGSPLYLYAHAFGVESNIWWGPYPPEWGKEFINYCWDEEGDYIVKAKVMDPYGAESDWATLEVTVPKNKSTNEFNPWLFRLIQRFPILEFLL
ncbi:C1 family peptidase [Thermoplasmatota archaeon]